jgi:TadE-like protein
VAVEAAIVTPLLMVLLLGIVEMSLLMRDVVSVNSSVRTAARIASASAGAGRGTCDASSNPPPCTPADAPAVAQAAADAVQRAGSAMDKNSIDWILIYDANTAGYPLPAGNTTINCTTKCVKYVWDDKLGKFRYSSGSWDSASINACLNDPARESVGIIMQAQHPWLTGFFGHGVTLSERSVMQFEPLANESCKPGTVNPHS